MAALLLETVFFVLYMRDIACLGSFSIYSTDFFSGTDRECFSEKRLKIALNIIMRRLADVSWENSSIMLFQVEAKSISELL